MDKPMEELLTVDEVAHLLKLQPWTVREWAKDKKIPGAVKYGRLWRFRKRTVEAWLAENRGLDHDDADAP
jgi:excisionase family DNA binding protein